MPLNSAIPIRKEVHFYDKKIGYQLNRSERDLMTRGRNSKFSRDLNNNWKEVRICMQ